MNTNSGYLKNSSTFLIVLGLLVVIASSWIVTTQYSILVFIAIIGIFLFIAVIKSPFSVLVLITFLIPIENFVSFQGITPNRFLVPLLFVGWCGSYFFKRKRIALSWPVLGMTGWIILGFVSYLWAPTINRLVENVFGYSLSLILLAVSSDLVNNKHRLYWIIGTVFAGQLSLIALWFLSGQIDRLGFLMPSFGVGSLSDYGNMLGAALACLLVLILYGRTWQRLLALLALLPAGYLFYASGLRRVMLSSFIVVLALLIFPKRNSWKMIVPTIILFVIFLFSWDWVLPQLPSSIQERFTVESALNVSAASRFELYNVAWDVWKTFPLLGSGLSSFPYYSKMSYGIAAATHNAYLEVLAETGLVGFILWAGSFSAILYKAIKTSRAQSKYPEQMIAAATLGLMFSILSNGLVGSFQTWRLLWLTMGVTIGATNVLFVSTVSHSIETPIPGVINQQGD